jgi:hypothetical protein
MSLYAPGPAPEPWHLARKVLLLLLLVVALALGLVILFRQRTAIPLLLFNVLADASFGLVAGLATRILLRRRHGLIQATASAAVSIVGLVVLGYFTGWRSGIGPFQAGLVRVHWLDWANFPLQLPLKFEPGTTDLLDLAHLAIAVDTGWIALRAWKPGRRASMQPAPSHGRQASRVSVPAARPSVVPSAPAGRIRLPARAASKPLIKRRTFGRPLIPSGGAVRAGRARSKRWNPLRHRPAVQLAVHEEHRCPYCLQDVNRDDPRGAVECPICHTLHHKDCWDITGTCQVPHLNN